MDDPTRQHISSELLGLIISTENKAVGVFGAYLAVTATVLATAFRGDLDLPLGISALILGLLGFVVHVILSRYQSWKHYYLTELQRLWKSYTIPDQLPVPFVIRPIGHKGLDHLIGLTSSILAVCLCVFGIVITSLCVFCSC